MSTAAADADALSARTEHWHTLTVTIPFDSNKHAEMARKIIAVDKLLRSETVSRELRVDDCNLHATFRAITVKQARVALDHFFSDVQLIADTIEQFDPEKLSARGVTDGQTGDVEVGAT